MDTIKQVMHFIRSTKGTHFFEAPILANAQIRSLYVQKEAFLGKPAPTQIVVTVEEAK